MKTKTLVLTLLLSTATLALLPNAEAVGTCTSLTNDGVGPDCPALFCLGTSWSWPDRYYRCDVQVPPHCCPVLP